MCARDTVQNDALLRDFRNFGNVTASTAQQVYETSYIFAVGNVRNEAILRDFPFLQCDNINNEEILQDPLQNGKLCAELTALCQCVL